MIREEREEETTIRKLWREAKSVEEEQEDTEGGEGGYKRWKNIEKEFVEKNTAERGGEERNNM